VDRAEVGAALVGLVVHRHVVGPAQGDVAGRVLVQQRVVEDRVQGADAALTVHQRDLAQPRGALVALDHGPHRVGARLGVDAHRAARAELDLQAADDRPRQRQRLGRSHHAVHPGGVGGGERLLRGEVGEVDDPLHGGEGGRQPA
jgi:hypothetical protein